MVFVYASKDYHIDVVISCPEFECVIVSFRISQEDKGKHFNTLPAVEEMEERFMASFIFQIKLLTPIGLLNDTSPLLTWRPNLDCAWQQSLPWYRWHYSILFQVFLAHCGASCVYGYEQQYASSMEGDIDCPKTNNADCPENPISLCQSTYKIVVF